MRTPAPSSITTNARPILTDDAFHGADEIPPLGEGHYVDTEFGRKRATITVKRGSRPAQ